MYLSPLRTSFACELKFHVVQVDPVTGEKEGYAFDRMSGGRGPGEKEGDAFEEKYPLEEPEISTSDFVAKVAVPDFRRAWGQMSNVNEVHIDFFTWFIVFIWIASHNRYYVFVAAQSGFRL